MLYKSNRGGGQAVDFETAILNGYAPDGGLYVPESLPEISHEELSAWKNLTYQELTLQILPKFIEEDIVPAADLKEIVYTAYSGFEKDEVIPLHQLKNSKELYIMELFFGPTISFKDVGMSFLVTLVNYFLQKRNDRKSMIVATTGDTGPAAAHYIAGKSNLDAWVLYPEGLVTAEQERQMTTIVDHNVYPISVSDCPEGGDDLDVVIANLYANAEFKEKVKLSSVNSLNWGRVMMQSVHYFYGYLKVAARVGDKVNFVVPSGGFGNLCAGGLAMKMGLPAHRLVIANNQNACLHRIFSQGIFSKAPIHATVSSAIDILVPINFWRFLYFCVDGNVTKINKWVSKFEADGSVQFDKDTFAAYSKGFESISIADAETLLTIKDVYADEEYLIDPHAAVAVAAARRLDAALGDLPSICLATAHPAKFPDIIKQALQHDELPAQGQHHSIEEARVSLEKKYSCSQPQLERALLSWMSSNWELNHKN